MSNNEFYARESALAVIEYRLQAVKYRYCATLRRCYLELAWKNRRQAREYASQVA